MMKEDFATNKILNIAAEPDNINSSNLGYFEDNVGISKISISVLHENGKVLFAGRRKSLTSSNFEDEPFKRF